MTSRYQDLCKSLEEARGRFGGYRSECVLFAATLVRGLVDHAGWPRELVTFEAVGRQEGDGPAHAIEDAMDLDEDAFWRFGLRLALEEPKGRDSIALRVRFKKLDTRYIVSLFGAEDYEVTAPTPEALRPIYEAILNAIARHYDSGLRLFLENGGRGLRIPISTARLLEMARGPAPAAPVRPGGEPPARGEAGRGPGSPREGGAQQREGRRSARR